MPTAITGLSANQQQFALALIDIVLLPLAPLGIDLGVKSGIPDADLYLTFALYIICMGASSKSPAFLGLSTLLAIFYLVAYGVAAKSPDYIAHGWRDLAWRYVPVVLFVVVHGCERHNRHIAGSEKFWDF